MRYYETLYIVNPNYEGDRLDSALKEVNDSIVGFEGVSVINHRVWGKKRLAYTIQNHKYGTYVLLQFEGKTGAFLSDFDTFLKLNKSVVRFQIIRLDEKPEVVVIEEPPKPEKDPETVKSEDAPAEVAVAEETEETEETAKETAKESVEEVVEEAAEESSEAESEQESEKEEEKETEAESEAETEDVAAEETEEPVADEDSDEKKEESETEEVSEEITETPEEPEEPKETEAPEAVEGDKEEADPVEEGKTEEKTEE